MQVPKMKDDLLRRYVEEMLKCITDYCCCHDQSFKTEVSHRIGLKLQ